MDELESHMLSQADYSDPDPAHRPAEQHIKLGTTRQITNSTEIYQTANLQIPAKHHI